ncbi:MAG: mechanosensitive ion channel family protein [Planctomycetota bacterium]|jgi:MscS family membrane protein
MVFAALSKILAEGESSANLFGYELIKGNAIWRFGLVLIVIIVTLAAGRIGQFIITGYAKRREDKTGVTVVTLFLNCLSKPISVAIFALGFYLCKLCLVFENTAVAPPIEGISSIIGNGWDRIAKAIAAIAVAYAIYSLVDVVEYYLLKWTSKTKTKLDDMLVPVLRKSLRTVIAIFAVIFIVDNILEQNVSSILLGAGVGGIAIALAAKDTVANFFGSVTIFADKPFQVDELVKIEGHYGPVEEVGFRSTKIRTMAGHQVIIPNNTVANSVIENVGRRPYIRRISNITITYDSGHTKAQKAVEIIKEILADVAEVNQEPEKPPRVYFNEFNDWSLNIYMSYWVKPPDFWLYNEVNERVNLEMMKRFEAAGIEFAFPSQTLYVKKE